VQRPVRIAYLSGVALFSAVALHQPAAGADLPLKVPVKAPEKQPSPYDWTGFYVGSHVGYATGTSNWSATQAAAPTLSGSLDLFNSYDAFKGTGSFFIGLQAGYNLMLPSGVVLGAEADLSAPNTIAGTQALSSAAIGLASYSDMVLLSGTARGRLGYAFDHWLPYVTGGFAWSYDQLTRAQLTGVPLGGSASAGTVESPFLWRLGWTAGAGVEVALGANWTAKLEYLFADFGRTSVTFPAGAQRFDSDLLTQTIKLGFNYQLGSDLTKSDVFNKGPSALDLDNFSLHGPAIAWLLFLS
jgi:high affinity Mn2+ porin